MNRLNIDKINKWKMKGFIKEIYHFCALSLLFVQNNKEIGV